MQLALGMVWLCLADCLVMCATRAGVVTGAVGLLGAAAGAAASAFLADSKRLSLGEKTLWAAFGAALSLQGAPLIVLL